MPLTAALFLEREKMKSLIIAVILVGVLLFIFFKEKAGAGFLPPHEFAYGSELNNIAELPDRINQFLTMDSLDTNKIQIETYVGNNSQKNLKPLIKYISSQKNFSLEPLIVSLNEIDKISNQKEKAIKLVKALLQYKDLLRDEPKQDYLIVFIYYGLKNPASLSSTSKSQINDAVRELDTNKQFEEFNGGNCPKNYLIGNINIYPLALENSSWNKSTDVNNIKKAPIFEVRFMGLRGIFKYLLNEYKAKTGASFVHLDGESL
jgi:hypothetical protein